ncbi:adhesion G-protein coupled receptor D1-like [Pomacea canaliculata]|uniref:adhesion G-protein coupled receptor D1-like n=1 Tax=Pomacea canaliculata TaxID=400727 RepID=UPI000D739514|nr:adhesion G-protein coupled receptor D1-like [Pomacea canaliculata]XP_025100316.1 adhesion G-protein coupled receptor D1-like [Pomacea canaliculata]
MPWANNNSDLANYMFLMTTDNLSLSARDEYILTKISLAGCGLSIVGSLLSVFLICYVPIRSDGLFSIGNLCFALLSAQLAFAGAENAFPVQVMCKISAAILHYLFLTFHCWALAYSIHLVMKLFHVLPGLRWKRRCILVAVGWVAPVIIVAVTAVIDADSYEAGRLCWLSEKTNARWAFVGPVTFIMIVNFAVMILMLGMRYLLDTKREYMPLKKLKHMAAIVCTLWPVSSLPWAFGLARSNDRLPMYIFVVLNSGQGLFIFLFHMLLSAQIRSLLRTRMNGEGEPPAGNEMHMSKSGSTGPSNDATESSIVNVGCGMKNIASRRG